MSGRREPSDEELTLWSEVVKSVRPLRPGAVRKTEATARPASTASKPGSPPTARPKPPPLPPELSLAHGPVLARERLKAVDGRTAERLRRGQIAPDGRLDLHGMTQSQAYPALLRFVQGHAAAGSRVLLVITGRGAFAGPHAEHQPGDRFVMPERPRGGILRALAPQWLSVPPLAALVVGIQAAHQKHGGTGAMYVYLRRAR